MLLFVILRYFFSSIVSVRLETESTRPLAPCDFCRHIPAVSLHGLTQTFYKGAIVKRSGKHLEWTSVHVWKQWGKIPPLTHHSRVLLSRSAAQGPLPQTCFDCVDPDVQTASAGRRGPSGGLHGKNTRITKHMLDFWQTSLCVFIFQMIKSQLFASAPSHMNPRWQHCTSGCFYCKLSNSCLIVTYIMIIIPNLHLLKKIGTSYREWLHVLKYFVCFFFSLNYYIIVNLLNASIDNKYHWRLKVIIINYLLLVMVT